MTTVVTNVFIQEPIYGLSSCVIFQDDKVVINTSDDEYGHLEFKLELLEQKIAEHKRLLSESRAYK